MYKNPSISKLNFHSTDEENEFYENLINTIREPLIALDKDLRVVKANRSFYDTFKVSPVETIGSLIYDLGNHQWDIPKLRELLETILPEKTSFDDFEVEHDFTTIGKRIMLLNARKIQRGLGKEQIILLAIEDITGSKSAELEILNHEKFLSSLFNSLDDAIFIINMPDRIIEHVNNAVMDIFGYSPQEVIGIKTRILYPDEEAFLQYGHKLIDAIKSNSHSLKAELNLLRKDGTHVWCDVQTTFLKEDGKSSRVILVMRDASERKKAQLLQSNFLANMSHELRTPLISINGFADFLSQDIKDLKLKIMAENIFNSGGRLLETLNLILDLSQLDSEKMDFKYKQVDLVNLTSEIISLFKDQVLKKGLFLKSSFNPSSITIDTDVNAFRSVLNNLITNAVKFTNEGRIDVGITLHESLLEIKVSDTGIGIARENHEIIFEEFRQISEGHNRNFEGTGLGLSITKKLVKKFGGEIIVESELGKGSAFIVNLPVTYVGEKTEINTDDTKKTLPVLDNQKLAKPLALVVDDDPFVFMVLERFTAEQADLERAANGELAVELCGQKQFDYIFMDINLGRGMDGKETTQMIRKIKGYESIPIIATTAYSMAKDKEEFLASGCSHYLSKPFLHQDIVNLMEEIAHTN